MPEITISFLYIEKVIDYLKHQTRDFRGLNLILMSHLNDSDISDEVKIGMAEKKSENLYTKPV